MKKMKMKKLHVIAVLLMSVGVVMGQYTLPTNAECVNGDFSLGTATYTQATGTNHWEAKSGIYVGSMINPVTGGQGIGLAGFSLLNFGNMIPGWSTTSLFHHSIQSPGTDPYTGISKTPIFGGSHSMKIGSDVIPTAIPYSTINFPVGKASQISKTFTVTAANTNINFWYALVLKQAVWPYVVVGNVISTSGYGAAGNAAGFIVYVTDLNTNTDISQTVNIGNGSNKVGSWYYNNFLTHTYALNSNIEYRDWTCANINLSNYIGKNVKIDIIAHDDVYMGSPGGGGFGYAYIDNFCVNCIGYNAWNATTSNCGVGNIIAGYSLMPVAAGNTSTVELKLMVAQNGGAGTQVGSTVTKSSGSSHSFSIDPSTLGLNASLFYFDYWIEATFKVNGIIIGSKNIGSLNSGQTGGNNNDYLISCLNGIASFGSVDDCGPGNIQVNYTLPNLGSGPLGWVDLELYYIRSGGNPPIRISSVSKNSGTSHIFNIDINTNSDLKFEYNNAMLNNKTHFDYFVKADFFYNNNSLNTMYIGSTIDGKQVGLNNDFGYNQRSCYNYSSIIKSANLCAPGIISINYNLPIKNGSYGTIDFKLKAAQDNYRGTGGKLITIATVTKSTGTNHVFKINPDLLALDKNLKGFDYWIEATYKFNGVVLEVENVGVPANATNPYSGRDLINNNDYLFYCPKRPEACTTK